MDIPNPFAPPEFACLDDLMHEVLTSLFAHGSTFKATKGGGIELMGVSVRLSDPRARLSRSETRGKVFSGLGELFWYLSGSNRLDFIQHYLPRYVDSSDDGSTIHGAYGPRLFDMDGLDQIQSVVRVLTDKTTSRRAAIQLFSASDLKKKENGEEYKDIPCTCCLQAILRDGKLNFFAYMRSNDAYLGLPHDVFAFTMLQEMIARALGVEVGFYQHMVGNLHLYDDRYKNARDYLGERFHSIQPMPAMPKTDPWAIIAEIRSEEAAIRTDPTNPPTGSFHPYWEDIFNLLRVHSENHHKNAGWEARIQVIKSRMHSKSYGVYFL